MNLLEQMSIEELEQALTQKKLNKTILPPKSLYTAPKPEQMAEAILSEVMGKIKHSMSRNEKDSGPINLTLESAPLGDRSITHQNKDQFFPVHKMVVEALKNNNYQVDFYVKDQFVNGQSDAAGYWTVNQASSLEECYGLLYSPSHSGGFWNNLTKESSKRTYLDWFVVISWNK